MANHFFRFKSFTVYQEKSSMKVCTDSCLFGAWVADLTGKVNHRLNSILDIGSGTGLLSLMLAQKTTARIDAVELEKNSFDQSRENFDSSPWRERLNVFHSDIKKWNAPGRYDFIIANPPFYENDLAAKTTGKNISKHNAGIRLGELLQIISRLLNEEGSFAVLLPHNRSKWFEDEASTYGLYIKEQLDVRQTNQHSFFRTFFLLRRNKTLKIKSEITIKENTNEYTTEFVKLLGDYYLNL